MTFIDIPVDITIYQKELEKSLKAVLTHKSGRKHFKYYRIGNDIWYQPLIHANGDYLNLFGELLPTGKLSPMRVGINIQDIPSIPPYVPKTVPAGFFKDGNRIFIGHTCDFRCENNYLQRAPILHNWGKNFVCVDNGATYAKVAELNVPDTANQVFEFVKFVISHKSKMGCI